jgi:hypothetical protein
MSDLMRVDEELRLRWSMYIHLCIMKVHLGTYIVFLRKLLVPSIFTHFPPLVPSQQILDSALHRSVLVDR